jgi:glycerophosphoryl diester phosphodiesterase
MSSLRLSLLILSLLSLGCGSEEPRYVAHAGGTLGPGRNYSNSLEALERSYSDGLRLFELDFSWTADRHLVAIHDWTSNFERFFDTTDLEQDFVPTLDDFMSYRMKGGYTQLDFESVDRWVQDHPDASIVTDIKSANIEGLHYVADRAADLSRYIPQIYKRDEIEEVAATGYDRIIFTLYRSPASDEEVADFARENELYAITIPKDRIWRNGLADRLEGVVTFVHTVNDCAQFQSLRNAGVHGIYTDSLSPSACAEAASTPVQMSGADAQPPRFYPQEAREGPSEAATAIANTAYSLSLLHPTTNKQRSRRDKICLFGGADDATSGSWRSGTNPDRGGFWTQIDDDVWIWGSDIDDRLYQISLTGSLNGSTDITGRFTVLDFTDSSNWGHFLLKKTAFASCKSLQ